MSSQEEESMSRPAILFACKQNAGRSQMAAAIASQDPRVTVLSAGTTPADEVHPQTVTALAEIGLSVHQKPALLSNDVLEQADWVITMGCGETCPIYPGKHYEDWDVSDPANQSLDHVRIIRDDIADRVTDLINRIMLAQ
ncbi:low molecular weight phosphatase family protein [Arcanobacterium phocae]|uniref:arsenate-mycothiol transferase ArsC n=1 Tax=Arcanobacterium phocae TaxID=131112 RepID=UPI00209F55C5|nr:heat-shock protein HtpX [Arcanobacterium phocae]